MRRRWLESNPRRVGHGRQRFSWDSDVSPCEAAYPHATFRKKPFALRIRFPHVNEYHAEWFPGKARRASALRAAAAGAASGSDQVPILEAAQ